MQYQASSVSVLITPINPLTGDMLDTVHIDTAEVDLVVNANFTIANTPALAPYQEKLLKGLEVQHCRVTFHDSDEWIPFGVAPGMECFVEILRPGNQIMIEYTICVASELTRTSNKVGKWVLEFSSGKYRASGT